MTPTVIKLSDRTDGRSVYYSSSDKKNGKETG